MVKTISYVEFGSTGHRPVWIKTVVAAFERRALGRRARLSIWVPPDFLDYHREWCAPYLESSKNPSISLKFHDNLPGVSSGNVRRGQSVLNTVRRCVGRDQAHVCFLGTNLDTMLRELSTAPSGVMGAKLVGVLCNPFLHYCKFASPRTRKWLKPHKWLFHYVKCFMTCHRSWMGEILMLDALAPAFYNAVLRSRKFRFLPEYLLPDQPAPQTKRDWGIPEDRKVLLLPGNFDARKGILEFLDALELALGGSAGFKTQAAVMIAGPVMPEIRASVYQSLNRLNRLHPDFPIRVQDRYLTDQEFVTLISLADVVCMPYKKYVGTSGILTLAAAYGRQVLVSDFGVIGELVRRNRFGIMCDESDPRNLAVAIQEAVDGAGRLNETLYAGMRRFIELYTISLRQYGEEVIDALWRTAALTKTI